MVYEDKESKVVGIRFPMELLNWIDSYSRIEAVNKNARITRNATVIGFLETMRAVIKERERTEWGGKSHQQMIADVLNGIKPADKQEG